MVEAVIAARSFKELDEAVDALYYCELKQSLLWAREVYNFRVVGLLDELERLFSDKLT